MDMAIHVQVGVIDPVRSAQIERRFCQLLTNRGNLGEALEQEGADAIIGVPTGHRRRIEDQKPADMQMHRGRLSIEKSRIQSAQLLHHLTSLHRHEIHDASPPAPPSPARRASCHSVVTSPPCRCPTNRRTLSEALALRPCADQDSCPGLSHLSPLRNIPVCDHRTPASS